MREIEREGGKENQEEIDVCVNMGEEWREEGKEREREIMRGGEGERDSEGGGTERKREEGKRKKEYQVEK